MGYKALKGLVHRKGDHMTEICKTRLVLGALMDEDIWYSNGKLSLPQEVMQQAFACADCNSQGALPMLWQYRNELNLLLHHSMCLLQTRPSLVL